MKKMISLFSVLLLVACSAGQTKESQSEPTSSELSSSSSSQSSSSSEKASSSQSKESSSTSSEASSSSVTVDYSLYNQVILDYNQLSSVNSDINPEANQAVTSSYYTGLEYSLYDLDKNGVDELLIALVAKDGYRSLLDLRTIKDGQVVRLTTNELSMIGNRMLLLPLADGTLYYKASGGASGGLYTRYRLMADGTGLEKVAEAETEAGLGNLPTALDLTSLTWQSVSSLESQDSASQTETASSSSGMDLQAIAKGDYSSITGTWQSGKADWPTLTISRSSIQATYPDGRIETLSLDFSDTSVLVAKGYLSGKLPVPMGGVSYSFIPVGISVNIGGPTDLPSDVSRERIWYASTGINPETISSDHFYYKVSD